MKAAIVLVALTALASASCVLPDSRGNAASAFAWEAYDAFRDNPLRAKHTYAADIDRLSKQDVSDEEAVRTLIVARELLRQDPSRQAGARDFVWRHVDDPDRVTRSYALRALGMLDGSDEIERLALAAERGSSREAHAALSALDFRLYLAVRDDNRGLDAVQTSRALQGVCERRANPTVVEFCKTLTSVHREQ